MSFFESIFGSNKSIEKTPVSTTMTETPSKTALFFMHQNRMKTSIVKTFNELGKHSSMEYNVINDKIRFYNACIIKMTISATDNNQNNILSLSLEYNGDTSAKKEDKAYWVTPDTPNSVENAPNVINKPNTNRIEENPNTNRIEENPDEINTIGGEDVYRIEENPNVKYTPRTIVIPNSKLKEILYFTTNITTPITCYFVRHGVATHNDPNKKIKTEINTKLVNLNDENIIKAGNFFASINSMNINAIFVSDLIRTHQTAGLFLKGYYQGKQIPDTLPIYVLPCSHELNGSAKDGETTLLPYYENKTNCRDAGDIDTLNGKYELCNTIVIDGKGIKLDWENYKKFYNKYRPIDMTMQFQTRESCRKNHFLGIAFDNYLNIHDNPTGGKPKRTTRKARKSQKPRKSRKSMH